MPTLRPARRTAHWPAAPRPADYREWLRAFRFKPVPIARGQLIAFLDRDADALRWKHDETDSATIEAAEGIRGVDGVGTGLFPIGAGGAPVKVFILFQAGSGSEDCFFVRDD
jgi:hypothetical protein